jgi:hypothetical protein
MSRENNKNAKEEYEIIIRGEKCWLRKGSIEISSNKKVKYQ